MRLGDLDALRKNMEFICMGIMAGTEPYNAPLTEIDNAPTVDTYTIEDIQEVRENSLILGAKLAQRPQGEWKLLYKGDDNHCANYECSICQREIYFDTRTESLTDYPFCHCGAKMQEGGVK